MRQLLQNLKTGKTDIAEIPRPALKEGYVLIRTRMSLISPGTERALVSYSKTPIIQRALTEPQKILKALDRIKNQGMVSGVASIQSTIDKSIPLGYCNVGEVIEASPDTGFKAGERVVSNGGHAEFVCVPKNLCARVPDGVSDEKAAYTVLGAIALQGVRLVEPTLGETVAVIGLGPIGLLSVQILRAAGCQVIALDRNPQRLAIAETYGAKCTEASGVDAVLIAAATDSHEPVRNAAQMCRKRGRIVLTGVTGLQLDRNDFYEKEISFQVSCSYGPGRYDANYEDKGQDYPIGFVRWTEQRNFTAILALMQEGRLDTSALTDRTFDVENAAAAYELIQGENPPLGVLLNYPARAAGNGSPATVHLKSAAGPAASPEEPGVGFIGAGAYGAGVLIPAFKKAGASLVTVAARSGLQAYDTGRRNDFAEATTEMDQVLQNPAVNTVVVTTRHDSHCHYTCEALKLNKNVFVEKPLALTEEEVSQIEHIYSQLPGENRPRLMVGFNRRFSPLTKKAMDLLNEVKGPKSLVFTINAGAIPATHWLQDRRAGGGRIIGEGCHFVDLARHMVGHSIVETGARAMKSADGIADTASLSLRFGDGSIATILYLANGSKAFPKERLEVFAGGRILQIDDFKTLYGFGWKGFKKMALWRQDKGQAACAAAFLNAIRSGAPCPIEFEEIIEVARVTIELDKALS